MITSRRRLTAPTDPIVTLAELYEHLHLDTEGSPPTHPEDATLALRVQAATDEIDAGNGWLGRALLPQRWRVAWRGFPCSRPNNPDAELRLPFPPLIEVQSVRYRDSGGDWVNMVEGTDYEVRYGDPYGSIAPLYLSTWPVTADTHNAVEVTFRCGYDETASPPNPLPDLVKQFVLVVAGTMYNSREEVAVNVNTRTIRQFRNALKTLQVDQL